VYFGPESRESAHYYYYAVIATASRLSLCLSAFLSLTLRYHDHIGWNTSMIISLLVKVPSHHDVLASARLALNKFRKRNAKRSNLQRSPNVHVAISACPALNNVWETF